MFKSLIGDDMYAEIIKIMPANIVCEIRLRIGRVIEIKSAAAKRTSAYVVTQDDINSIIRKATKNSLYAYQEELKAGYLKYEGGIRIGISGDGVCENGRVLTFKNISSLNVRIPHEVLGVAKAVFEATTPFDNIIVLSPPYGGKTTMIRDIARVLSGRMDTLILDERRELYNDAYTFGPYLDVVTDTPKGLAIEGIIRAMNPDVIVMDELYPAKDGIVVEEILRAGIKMVASAHSQNHNEFFKFAPNMREAFRYAVNLGNNPRAGSIKSIVRL